MKFVITIMLVLIVFQLEAQNEEVSGITDNNLIQQSEKTNLALRQAVHHLLLQENNDSSYIPPVRQTENDAFEIKVDHIFNYESFPSLLNQALIDYDLGNQSYYVAIKDCQSDSIILGYNSIAFTNQTVACVGREQIAKCGRIFLTFPGRVNNNKQNRYWLFIPVTFLLLTVGAFLMIKTKTQEVATEFQGKNKNNIAGSAFFIPVGQHQLDATNHLLYRKESHVQLTYRESKLLHFFAKHPNQLLEREQILQAVWKEEGIIVGRSLDVFVSRLRKILKEDPSVQIKNVHGLGYRMEVR